MYGNASFIGWSIKRVRRGYSDLEEFTTKDGKKAKPFNFSGRLVTLPEFHRALKKIKATGQIKHLTGFNEAMSLPTDEFDIVDLSLFGEELFTPKVMKFSEFCAYVEHTQFQTNSGHWTMYQSIALTKKKSEKTLKNSRSTNPAFFLLHIPARNMDNLILAIEMLMKKNDMEHLKIEGGVKTCSLFTV